MEKIKVIIVGLKHLHPITYMPHLNNLKTEIVGIFEDDESVINQKKGAIPSDIKISTDLSEFLKDPKPDIAIIFTPLDENPNIINILSGNKINLIIEKPLAASYNDSLEILKICEKNNIIASVPYVWRYHAGSKEIKRLVQNGYIGKIQAIEGRCIAGRIDRYITARSEWIIEKKRAGGGSMWNLGCHWIDLFGWFLNFPEIERVYSEYSNFSPDINIEENSSGIIKYRNGVVVTLNIGYSSPPSFPYGRDLHINLRGTLGTIVWSPAFEGMDDEIFVCSDHPELCSAPNRTIKLKQKPTDGYAGMMGFDYLKEYFECMNKNKEPFITINDGVKVLKIADALNRSAETNSVIFL